jgi:hypothetical protein
MKENLITGAVAVVVSVVLVGLFFTPQDGVNGLNGVDGRDGVGAPAGPDVYQRLVAHSGLSVGGILTVATTGASYTLTDTQLDDARVISISDMGAGQSALALTLPASTTWTSLPGNGDSQSWIIDSVVATAATTTTITAGTGVDIDGTTANDDVINGGVSGRLECWRLPSTDVRCIVEEMVDAG